MNTFVLSDFWNWIQVREAKEKLRRLKHRHRNEVQRFRGIVNLSAADGKQLGAAANAVAAIIKVEKELSNDRIPQRTPILERDQDACQILQPLWDAVDEAQARSRAAHDARTKTATSNNGG